MGKIRSSAFEAVADVACDGMTITNWTVPGRLVKGMGGAMDLAAGARRVPILTEHTARDRSPKIVSECTLPLTGGRVAGRIITNLAVFDITPTRLRLAQTTPGIGIDKPRAVTGAPPCLPGTVIASAGSRP